MSVADQRLPASGPRRGATLAVRLSPQFANRICARIRRTALFGGGMNGLLFGVADEALVILQAFKSLTDSDHLESWLESWPLEAERLEEAFEKASAAAETDPEVSSLDLIGWFSVRSAGGLHLPDVIFHERHFPRLNHLAVVLVPEGNGDLLMEFYSRASNARLSAEDHCWGALRLSADIPFAGPVEVSMRGNSGGEPNAIKRSGKKEARKTFSLLAEPDQPRTPEFAGIVRINAGSPSAVPAIIPRRKKRRLPWISSAILFALAAGATFAVLLLGGLPSGLTMPPFLHNLLPDTRLELKVEGQGDRVLLTWNRRNLVVRTTVGGTLHIDDGTQHRDWPLDAGQIQNGAVLYRPASGDVTFRMEVRGQQGATAVESTRVLDGRAGAPQEDGTANLSVPKELAPADPKKWTAAAESRTVAPIAAARPPAEATGLAEHSPPAEFKSAPDSKKSDSPDAAQQSAASSAAPSSVSVPAQTTADGAKNLTSEPPNQLPLSYLPPRPTRKVLPDVSGFSAESTDSLPDVEVAVRVDESGRVIEAHVVDKGNKIKPALAGAALSAAKAWIFQPAVFRGQYVKSDHTIVFQFHPSR